MSDPGPFDAIVSRGRVAAELTDDAWLAALLEVESALAFAEADAGLIPEPHARAIAEVCRTIELDAATIGREAASSGTPVIPLLAALRARLSGDGARSLQFGATSQDIIDSATMLVTRRAIDAIRGDLDGTADAAAELAQAHRGTLMAGRTLLQHAEPITFGLKAAGWLSGLDVASARLSWLRSERLAVQLGGAAGTLSALGDAGTRVIAAFAERLVLPAPALPWHTERSRIADVAGGLGLTAAAVSKVALDIVLLAQTEVAEVRDTQPGRGASSTLPHKHNEIAAVAARASAAQAPGLVANLLTAAGGPEHERGAGPWHAEWRSLAELLRSVGSATAWLRDALEHLGVDVERMRANVDLTGQLNPGASRGSTDAFIDGALAAHRGARRSPA